MPHVTNKKRKKNTKNRYREACVYIVYEISPTDILTVMERVAEKIFNSDF